MTEKEAGFVLDEQARRSLAAAYRLLLQLANEEEAADSKDLSHEPELSTAQDGADEAPSQIGG